MADVLSLVNASGIGEGVAEDLLPPILDKISPLVTIFKAVGIALLVYIIFLILKAFFGWRTASKIRKIARSVEQINRKLDVLVEGKRHKENMEKVEKPKRKGFLRKLVGKRKKK